MSRHETLTAPGRRIVIDSPDRHLDFVTTYLADHSEDMTDHWQQATDSESERGEIAIGQFDRDSDGYFVLRALCVGDNHGWNTYPRDRAIGFLGLDTIQHVERALDWELGE